MPFIYHSHLVAGEGAGGGGGVVLLARLVVEDAHDHQRVGAREARASLVLLSIDGVGRSHPIRFVHSQARPPAQSARPVEKAVIPPDD